MMCFHSCTMGGGEIVFIERFGQQIQSCVYQDFSKNGEDVLTYLHGLPDQTWPEPEPQDPLSVIDQVDICLFVF